MTPDVAGAVKEYKAGKVEFRNDKGGNIHAIVGKLSFDADKLAENATALIEKVLSAKPHAVKGVYVKSAYLTATMTPSIKLAV